MAWRLTFGDPGELCVLHSCDNPPCQNPRHLFLGTQLDNVRDMDAKGRCQRVGPHKISEAVIAEIRSRLTGRWGEQRRLAREYGLSESTISSIARAA